MIERKRFVMLSTIALLVITSTTLLSFIIGGGQTNLITGRATSTAYILETPPENCTTFLRQGYNFVSFYCETGDLPFNQSLVNQSNNTLNYQKIFSYSPSSTNDFWKSYNPGLPDYVKQDLKKLDRRAGYWLYMNNSDTYFREGRRFFETEISLVNSYQGWNLIGYPNNESANITEFLASIEGNYSRIESYQDYNGTYLWLIYDLTNNSNLTQFDPMKAYWIKSIDNASYKVYY